MQEQSGALHRSPQRTGRIGRVKELFPATRAWPDEAIMENLLLFQDTYRHLRGDCGGVFDEDGVPIVREIFLPEETPGSFRKEECISCRQWAVKELVKRARFPKRHLTLSLDQLDAREKVLPYTENFPENKKAGHGLLIVGPTGIGKTQLAVALGVEIILRHLNPATFVLFGDLCTMFREAINDDFARMNLAELTSSKNLVIVDDLGAVPITGFDHANINSFIDARYREKLPTVFTSNLSRKEMIDYLGERAVSRLSEMCETIVLRGKDRRGR
ncbi:IstB-like ATP binding protein [Desulfofundulus australicus DSM 11792]|uniref:IstB-like ATP binding protein n=1 Tax=Desulfofundulus australicus DSM 11792 TaxID=1121425 RepID=A0A1M5E4R4_9FIRM|nr:ATP-binding protein [Desulfofundulus australicus]SHF74134.1 IstB-like ATP binding protein [Desulfofundulus australicus DSM 11792]